MGALPSRSFASCSRRGGVNIHYDKSVWARVVARNTASLKLPRTTYKWQEARPTARRMVFDSDGESRQKKRSKEEPFPKTDLEAEIFTVDSSR